MNEWNDMQADIDRGRDVNAELRALRQMTRPPAKKSRVGRARQKQGADSENLARRALERMGFVHVKRVKTYYSRNGRYAIKAEADFRAIESGTGRYVLAEVKDITGGTLPFSRIQKHQRGNLNTVHEAGGVALLIITHDKETAVLRWPVEGFEPRTSIKWADALKMRGE